MSYLRTLQQLREKMSQRAAGSVEAEEPTSIIPVRQTQEPVASTEDLLSRSASWLSQIKEGAYKVKASAPEVDSSGTVALAQALGKAFTKKDAPSEEGAAFIERRSASSPSTYAPERPDEKARREAAPLSEAPDTVAPGYGDIKQKTLEQIIRQEASARNMDPDTAVAIFRSEGAGNYQSQVPRKGKGSYGGKEDSYGPFQLYRGGGLGNEYEELTGRDLRQDNTIDGITNQIRFSLDRAVSQGWTPWYGRKTAGVGVRDGLANAKALGNWQ